MYNVKKIERQMRWLAWTLHDVAQHAKVSVSTVQRTFDVGSARPATIKRMALAVGLSMDDVLEDEEVDSPKSARRRRANV